MCFNNSILSPAGGCWGQILIENEEKDIRSGSVWTDWTN